jgi:hypothetical protein
MEIDTRFPTRLDTVSDAPEPLRSALVKGFSPGEPIRLLVHAPAFPMGDEKSPATVLGVTNSGWLVASETEAGGATLEKSDFSDILFLELTSILLSGQLRISFAALDTSHSVTIKFETVEDEVYREAVDLMLAGIDPARTAVTQKVRSEASMFEAWPMKFRNEAKRYRDTEQRLLAAVHWPAIFDGFQRQLASAGALLITERELVLISAEKNSSAESPQETPSAEEPKEMPPEQETAPLLEKTQEITATETPSETAVVPIIEKADIDATELQGELSEFGGNITFVPRVRLADFHVGHQERFGVLALHVHAANGGEKLDIIFPSEDEKAVSKAMEQVLLSPGSAT